MVEPRTSKLVRLSSELGLRDCDFFLFRPSSIFFFFHRKTRVDEIRNLTSTESNIRNIRSNSEK